MPQAMRPEYAAASRHGLSKEQWKKALQHMRGVYRIKRAKTVLPSLELLATVAETAQTWIRDRKRRGDNNKAASCMKGWLEAREHLFPERSRPRVAGLIDQLRSALEYQGTLEV